MLGVLGVFGSCYLDDLWGNAALAFDANQCRVYQCRVGEGGRAKRPCDLGVFLYALG